MNHWLSWVHQAQIWDDKMWQKAQNKITLCAQNTLNHSKEQFLALPSATYALFSDKEDMRRVRTNMFYILCYDLAPVVLLFALNKALHDYCQHESDNGNQISVSFLCSSVLAMIIHAYAWRKSADVLVHVMVLDAFAPTAFHAQKKTPVASLCESNCDMSRRFKGAGREIAILWANDFLIGSLTGIPYVGAPLAKMARIMNHGRYIMRVATPERCERHKLMKQEFVLSLGLLFELSHFLFIQQLMARTTGPLPFLYVRALHHILLLLHVNLAIYTLIPAVTRKDATLSFDFFHYYEATCRFFFDVLWAGFLVRVSQDKEFKTTLTQGFSWVLQQGTRMLQEHNTAALNTPSKQPVSSWKQWMLPKMFHSMSHFIADPVFAPYWPHMCQSIIQACSVIEKQETGLPVTLLQKTPKRVKEIMSLALFTLYGISPSITKTVFHLVKNEDFWCLAHALKQLSERYHVTVEKELVHVVTHAHLMDEPLDSDEKKQEEVERKEEPSAVPHAAMPVNQDGLVIQQVEERAKARTINPGMFFKPQGLPVHSLKNASTGHKLGFNQGVSNL